MKVVRNVWDLSLQSPFQIAIRLLLLEVVSINLNNKQNHAKSGLRLKIVSPLDTANSCLIISKRKKQILKK